ncbi:hypothetical protein EVJ58_g4276 [Rhodofomes roseus]|uniref:Uncharacterized protein n=1 Tax=Rhodofomes roseus TaxID=34475 RepID=A0A4Y9YJ37_9APHY|nr:hypothetical protein EVJ58_g4276 [Rhodofomes roseus]
MGQGRLHCRQWQHSLAAECYKYNARILEDSLQWDGATGMISISDASRKKLDPVTKCYTGTDKDDYPTTYAHRAQLRELFPGPKPPKTKCDRMWQTIKLREKHLKVCSELRVNKLAAPAQESTSSNPTQENVPAAPSTPARSTGSAAPLSRAHSSPVVYKSEYARQPAAPGNIRAPLLDPSVSFAPQTPVSNPRPVRRIDTIREESPSPTVSRRDSMRVPVQARAPDPQDPDEHEDGMDVDDGEDENKMDVDAQELVPMPPGPSFIDKGKGLMWTIASAVAGVASPMRLLSGSASQPEGPIPACPDARDDQITALETQVADLRARLDAALRDVTAKDQQIADLQEQLAEKQAALAGLVNGFLPAMPALAVAVRHVRGAGVSLAECA